ncbi:Serpin domain containing protein [Asbolus verrucosus]|uniref:Serpin domain containing protein n=1 Tax=Asbolus verrucosus TaxID=1661398 RepID=A0A482VZX2_ASBVE|nr:Serpin domain containing protein [Asbolus verrucosus]
MESISIVVLSILICVFANEFNEFTSSNNLFAASIYKEIVKSNEKNFLVSPFSAETILTLAQFGARGETARELQTALCLPDDHDKIESSIKSLLPTLKGNDNYSLHVANKIYVKQGCTLKGEFQRVAADVFNAGLENIDFSQNAAAASKMNNWVAEQTANKIHDLISKDSLDDDTRAVLINALYFKGNWSEQFDKRGTRNRNFYENEKDSIMVETMHDPSGLYNYYEDAELKAKFLEVSLKDPSISMTFILPSEREGLASLEGHVEKVFLPRKYSYEQVNVALPRFKIESKLNCKEILRKLGVKKAFVDGQADFSGVSDEDLAIDEVIQKTFIEVSEDGVEAAAATEVGMNLF